MHLRRASTRDFKSECVNARSSPRPVFCAAAMLTLCLARAGCNDGMTEPLPETVAAARDRAAIEALYNATEGPEWVQRDNWLTDAPLSDWHGVVTDSAGRIVWLTLPGNGLTGTLPPELGDLTELQHLWLSDNELRGPIPTRLGDLTQLAGLYLQDNRLTGFIPESLLELEHLRALDFGGNQGLCIPGTAAFTEWAAGVSQVIGLNCAGADRMALEELFEATGGSGWINSNGWLGDAVLDEWSGVETDSIGQVSTLDLGENGFSGMLPEVVGELSALRRLDVGGNRLTGELPRSLTELPLEVFRYADTQLCVPHDSEFQEWLRTVDEHDGTGTNCTPESEREALIALYTSTNGPNWTRNDNWMTNAPIGEWLGVTTDRSGHVTHLSLGYNAVQGAIPSALGDLPHLRVLELSGNYGLTGPIPPEFFGLSELQELHMFRVGLAGGLPPEIGRLTGLTSLSLRYSGLAGPLPAELGRLVNLEYLDIGDNDLSGPIPRELGSLSNLALLRLQNNELTGGIPVELGNLISLEYLYMQRNQLTGHIPRELGNLVNLKVLWLSRNALTGTIPPAMASMRSLERLYMYGNDLDGPLPPELGGLTALKDLWLGSNAGLSGPIPASLKALAELEEFKAGGTDLCAPADPELMAWLNGVEFQRVARCDSGGAAVYLTQTIQSREFPVPLIAGRPALLRVFVSSPRANGQRIPPVRATFYRGGTELHVVEIAGGDGPIPTEIDESALSRSANAEIPGHVIRDGLEMVIEVDPTGILDAGLGIVDRIPETGRMAVDVREMPDFRLTVVPFLYDARPDSAILDITADMANDPEGSEMLSSTRSLLPIGDLDVRRHDPVVTSTTNGIAVLREVGAIRHMEGGSGYWMGMLSPIPRGLLGVAAGIRSWASFSTPAPFTVAHELGHNMGLYHAPCGGAGGPDPLFPDRNGRIGSWGYDVAQERLITPYAPDIMSYCRGGWISDYHYSNALRHRLDAESGAATSTAPTRTVLVWGGLDSAGDPFLDPAFVVDAAPSLPPPGSGFRLRGRTADGGSAFSLTFDMPEILDLDDGRSSFVLTVPVTWTGTLASISLVGDGGSAMLDRTTDSPMTILRDPVTGQVRAFLRGPEAAAMALDGGEPPMEVLFSRGIPDEVDQRR
ncbi:MAG: hypothetical protein F4Y73_00155 [Gemmatimonadetes bacterium]|nr:hypothetical protein [Gemmatimonadota bacterium]